MSASRGPFPPTACQVEGAMLSRFFIDRPIFAMVIAIVIMLAGALSPSGPADRAVSRPSRRRRSCVIGANYPGARRPDGREFGDPGDRAAAHRPRPPALLPLVQRARTARSASASPSPPGTNPDIAQVQVQNKLQSRRMPLLPAEVQQQGDHRRQVAGASFLMVVALYDTSGRYTDDRHRRLSEQPPASTRSRGSTASATCSVFGGQYAMRIWLDPYKLQRLQADAVGRAHRRPRPRTSRSRPARSAASRRRPGQELERHRSPPSRACTRPEQFRRHHPARPSPTARWCGWATSRGSSSARRRLRLRQPAQRPPGRAASASSWRPGANALATADGGQAKRGGARRQPAPGPAARSSRSTPPPSSGCRSSTWSSPSSRRSCWSSR